MNAPGFLLGGFYSSVGPNYVDSNAYYWSRTTLSTQRGYGLYLNASSVNPARNYNKYVGFAVRCLLK